MIGIKYPPQTARKFVTCDINKEKLFLCTSNYYSVLPRCPVLAVIILNDYSECLKKHFIVYTAIAHCRHPVLRNRLLSNGNFLLLLLLFLKKTAGL